MRKIIVFLFILNGMISKAQDNLNIVPMPAEVKMGNGYVDLRNFTAIQYFATGTLNSTVRDLANKINNLTGNKIAIWNFAAMEARVNRKIQADNLKKTNFIDLVISPEQNINTIEEDAYNLSVTKNELGNKITIT